MDVCFVYESCTVLWYKVCVCRVLAVGEPLNHEAWEWYHRVVGENRCPIVDTWWQTGESTSQCKRINYFQRWFERNFIVLSSVVIRWVCVTETGGILIAPRPSEPGAVIRPAMPMRPFFGIEPAIMNEKVTLDTLQL